MAVVMVVVDNVCNDCFVKRITLLIEEGCVMRKVFGKTFRACVGS
jgi:hypothetical protein